MAVRDNIPVTAIERTLIDVGRYWDAERVGALLDHATRERLTTYERFAERVHGLARRGRPGIAAARRALEDRAMTDGSTFETLVRRELNRSGLSRPIAQFPVEVDGHRHYLDFAWPTAMVALECDTSTFHALPHQFESDLARQNRLVNAGWTILRYTPAALRRDPDRLAIDLGAALRPHRRMLTP